MVLILHVVLFVLRLVYVAPAEGRLLSCGLLDRLGNLILKHFKWLTHSFLGKLCN